MTVHVTIPIEEAAKADLDTWAKDQGVPLDAMLAEVLGAYVADRRELDAAITEGLADIEAGRVTPHEDVVARLRAQRAEWGSAE